MDTVGSRLNIRHTRTVLRRRVTRVETSPDSSPSQNTPTSARLSPQAFPHTARRTRTAGYRALDARCRWHVAPKVPPQAAARCCPASHTRRATYPLRDTLRANNRRLPCDSSAPPREPNMASVVGWAVTELLSMRPGDKLRVWCVQYRC